MLTLGRPVLVVEAVVHGCGGRRAGPPDERAEALKSSDRGAEWLAPEARAAAAQVALELGGQRVAVDLAQRLGHVDLGVTPLLQ